MISVTGLSKKYGSHTAVKNVDFTINDGEIVGFLGPNGAGKSTIMNILTGYLSPTAGSINIDGYDIMTDPKEAKMRIGYLPEIPPLYPDMTVREYLGFIYELKKVRLPKAPHIEEILKLVRIDDAHDRLIKNLSKGYRQRVGIAQALIGNPDVLILDEPTVGLDPRQIIEIRELIKKLGKHHTVILSSHILSEIQEICERIIIINHGELIADGTPNEIAKTVADDKSVNVRIVGDDGYAASLFDGMENVTVNVSRGTENGTVDINIHPTDGSDIRAEVFKMLCDKNAPVLQMTSKTPTLEELFLKLTQTDETNEEEE